MRFPFLFLSLALGTGILAASRITPELSASLVPALISLVCAWLFFFVFKKANLCLTFIILTAFFLGASLFTHSNTAFKRNALHNWESPSYADFEGTVAKSPLKGPDRDVLLLKVKKIYSRNEEENISGNLRVSILHSDGSPPLPLLHVQDKVKISAKLTASQGFQNFSGSSFALYLKSQNVHNRAFAKSPLLVEKIASGPRFSPLRMMSILHQKLQKKIEVHFPGSSSSSLSSEGAVLEALLLGERGRMDTNTTRSLQESGLFHLFAISGAHIGIISFLLFSLLKIMRISSRTSYVLLILFLVFYVFLVEGRPSVFRAAIMAVSFLLGKLLWRDVNLVNTLSFSAFILLLINPFNLFSLGFQMTFAATLSIILFFPKIIKYLPRLPLKLSEIFAISLTAQLGVLPFIIHAFNRVTFAPLILNFAALPLVGLIMASGYIFLCVSFVSPVLGLWTSEGIGFLIRCLVSLSGLSGPFDSLSYRIPTPHLLIIAAYFFFLLLLLLPSRVKKQKLLLLCGFGIFFIILITYPFPSHSKNLKITFIDVGQGDSMLVEFPGTKKMLVDGGGIRQGNFDIGESVVSPFLWKKGIKQIDYLVLTHAHPDHFNGLKAVVKNFIIGEFWEAFSPSEDESYAEFKASLPQKTHRKRVFRGHKEFIGNTKIDILHPPEDEPFVFQVQNAHSLVMRITSGETAFLLTGDIGAEVEDEICAFAENIRSQVLKSPHHGSDSSSSQGFLDAVAPQIIVISVGAGNTYGFPRKDVLERYSKSGAAVYRTDLHGAVQASSDGKQIHVRTSSEAVLFP